MSKDYLDKKANIGFVQDLYRERFLNDDAIKKARRILRPASGWYSWSKNLLLLLGVALVLAGIIFFFAYNWKAMGKFLKFGLIEATIVLCTLPALLLKRDSLVGKVLLLAAAVITGVLMAVFGQTYQTGADAFELFVNWSILILGWVIVSEFAALWVTWLVIVNTGLILYWGQVVEPVYHISFELLFILLAAINSTALLLRERGALRRIDWLQGRWHRGVIVSATLICLSVPTLSLILDAGGDSIAVAICGAVAWIAACVGIYFCYRRKLKDMVPLALMALDVCIVVLVFLGWLLFDVGNADEAMIFVMALLVIGVFSLAAWWLRNTAAELEKEAEEAS